jgi:hypothetical protein
MFIDQRYKKLSYARLQEECHRYLFKRVEESCRMFKRVEKS